MSRHETCVENLEGELKRIGKELNESLYREVQLLEENERLKEIIKEMLPVFKSKWDHTRGCEIEQALKGGK